MVNPKTGKPQLQDFEYRGPKRKPKPPPDIFSEDIDSLPNPESDREEADNGVFIRREIDGELHHKK